MKERSMDHEACPETKLYYGIFAEPGAYPYPFGSECVGWLDTVDDAVLRGLPFGRLRDQAVAVDAVCAEWKGRYLELEACAKLGGWTPQFVERRAAIVATLRRLQDRQRRLRPIRDAYRQPRRHVERN
jgi:hypothetical protein